MTPPSLYLASKSEARARLMRAAGISFDTLAVAVDEEEIKAALLLEKATPAHIAETLAELKAMRGSLRQQGALVIGADQVLACDGVLFSKPQSLQEAQEQLQQLKGRSHDLLTAVVMAQNGRSIWRHLARARLYVRDFSDAFLHHYLMQMGTRALHTVGAYEVEGLGAQLFERIDGDHFTIQGLPLMPLLAILREHGVVMK